MDAERDDDQPDDGPIDWFAVDIGSLRPGIPWRPSVALVLAATALPVLSLILAGPLTERLAAESPDQVWIVDVWRTLAGVSLVFGSALVAAVPVSAHLARGRPEIILRLLGRGFPIGVLGVAFLVILHALLAYAFLLAGQRLVLGFAAPSLPGILLFAGVASAVYLATSGAGALREMESRELAVTVGRADAPSLHELVDRLSERIGVAPPDALLMGPSMDTWTGQSAFRTVDAAVTGTVVHLSLPQLSLLSVPALEGILAHELGHVRNGDTIVEARLRPSFASISAAIDALRKETSSAGRVAAEPALLWLDFASEAAHAVVAEARRVSEMAADAVAVEVVGPAAFADGLVSLRVINAFDEAWAGAVERAMESPEIDPIASFTAHVREAVPDITIQDVIEASIDDIGPTHPALVSRLRAVGVHEATFDVSGPSALDALAPAHAHLVVRLLDALRQDTEIDAATETRNPPRLTPGTVGWAIVGAVFAAIFLYRFAIDGGPAGESLLIVLVITGLWLLYPLIYPWFQRELILDRTGVRVRSWWRRWLDPDARHLGWTQIPWTGSMSMTIGFESIITFSNGATTTRWWGAIWPKRDLTRLVDDLRARGAVVRFTSDFGQQDHARHAVVWYVRDRFLVPEVRMTEEGDFLEVRPIKVVRPDPVPLMSALVDRLHDPVKPGGRDDRRADTEYLASRVDLAAVAFTAEARRLFIDRDRDSWTIRLENASGIWVADRRMDEMDLAENIFGILGIEETA